MLEETAPALALELWLAVRRIRMWLITPESRRRELFQPQRREWISARREQARREAPELGQALEVLGAFPQSPQRMDAAALADALYSTAEWAAANDNVETAIQCAEAAALMGCSPAQSLLAGRLTRNAGDFGRAELWFDRAIAAAHAENDPVAFIRGHLGYGILCMTVGRDACARKHFNTASVYAMQEGFEWLAAEAQHDLFHFMVVRGDLTAAELHARRALKWYPKHHQRFPFFAIDVGFLLVLRGQHSLACRLLREALRVVERPEDTVLGLSVLVRALAGSGSYPESIRVARRLETLLARHSEFEAAARWNLGEAHRSAGLADKARASAELSLRLAQANRDPETERFARELLEQLARDDPAPVQQLADEPSYTMLIETLISRVREWTPNRRGRSRSIARPGWAA